MTEKSRPNSPFLQLAQAQQFLDLGHRQEALTLALDVLLQELVHLQEALLRS